MLKYKTRAMINRRQLFIVQRLIDHTNVQNVQMENGTTDKPQWFHCKVLNSFKGSQPEVTSNPGLNV